MRRFLKKKSTWEKMYESRTFWIAVLAVSLLLAGAGGMFYLRRE